jgi:hypothetical protein
MKEVSFLQLYLLQYCIRINLTHINCKTQHFKKVNTSSVKINKVYTQNVQNFHTKPPHCKQAITGTNQPL